ncbi:PLP-dependent aminotransferase family protein [uncultured Roseobacter sp.]|uniref:aminotransferase-like domain-containing protein n=1 Tax=uncultured Roseobacter sp. TaxID=114847 RepID=UPI00260C4FFD|nr:PLP-dependent aminotransferase family protein [uncultured Roseobacter sp.]
MKPYVQIADRIARSIATGELPLGARLPPQRIFAFDEQIAVSTASRVYEELTRRGLVKGEIGRGTFVSNRFAPLDPSLQEPSGTGIDLEIMFRLSTDARNRIAASTNLFFKAGVAVTAVTPPSVRASRPALSTFARLTSEGGFKVDPSNVLLAGNGKQAIAATFSALAPRGGRIAVEALTYPFAIATARMLGVELVPLPLDGEGIIPHALDRAADAGLNGAYLQTTLQSPLVVTMSESRREQIAAVLRKHNLAAIEDRVYGFLKPTRPLAAFAPDHVIQIDSLSKRLMPGLSLGIIACPRRFDEAVARSLRSGGWMAPSLSVGLAQHWIEDGVVDFVEASKRQDAKAMFDIARSAFEGLDYQSSPEALHGWLMLPSQWRADSFVSACADLGIAVAPGSAFAVGKSVAPTGVRIAYSAPDLSTWTYALREVAKLATAGSESNGRPL